MHDKKVNTKTTGVTSTASKNVVLDTPYGQLHIESVDAHDYANMKAHQLEAALLVITGDGHDVFANLTRDIQNSFLWMLQQSASELNQLLGEVKFAEAEVTK